VPTPDKGLLATLFLAEGYNSKEEKRTEFAFVSPLLCKKPICAITTLIYL
jgi:hypothetical protein